MKKLIYFFFLSLFISACSSTDCPLSSGVLSRYKLMGSVKKLADTLTISTQRHTSGDTILLNKAVNVDSFDLPMSFQGNEDVLFLSVTDTNKVTWKDTIRITKTNEPHFESVDCAAAFFHTIQKVTFSRNAIDSVVVHKSKVTNDNSQTHFYLYFKSQR